LEVTSHLSVVLFSLSVVAIPFRISYVVPSLSRYEMSEELEGHSTVRSNPLFNPTSPPRGATLSPVTSPKSSSPAISAPVSLSVNGAPTAVNVATNASSNNNSPATPDDHHAKPAPKTTAAPSWAPPVRTSHTVSAPAILFGSAALSPKGTQQQQPLPQPLQQVQQQSAAPAQVSHFRSKETALLEALAHPLVILNAQGLLFVCCSDTIVRFAHRFSIQVSFSLRTLPPRG
jgi:hypothetical protein